jgi:hypothetical protein
MALVGYFFVSVVVCIHGSALVRKMWHAATKFYKSAKNSAAKDHEIKSLRREVGNQARQISFLKQQLYGSKTQTIMLADGIAEINVDRVPKGHK